MAETTDSGKKLSEKEIRDLFIKYDVNKDEKIDSKELTNLVTDMYKKSHGLTEINEKDQLVVDRSVAELLRVKDSNSDGHLQFDEFVNNYNGLDIFQHSGNVFFLYCKTKKKRNLLLKL